MAHANSTYITYMELAGLTRVRKPGLVAASAIRKIAPSNNPFITLFVEPVVPCGAATRDDHGWTPSTNRHHSISQNQAGFSISPVTVPGDGGANRVPPYGEEIVDRIVSGSAAQPSRAACS